MPWNTSTGASHTPCATHRQLRAMARQGGSLHHELPPNGCDTRHNPYDTGERDPQRAIVRETTRSVLLLFIHRRSIMNWYMEVLKKYAVFNGRARRAEYWWFFLINFIFVLVLSVLSRLTTGTDSNSVSPLSTAFSCISGLYSLAVLLPELGVGIRRLHDIGKSGWWLLIGLIPLIGTIWLLILAATDSQPGDNQYGPNPKGVASPTMAVPPTMTQP